MSKSTIFVLAFLGLVIMATAVYMPKAKAAGCAPFLVASGGTGACTFTGGSLLFGNGTGKLGAVATTTVSCAGTASCTQFVAIGPSPITITGSASGGGTYPFTPTTYNGIAVSATSTPIWNTYTGPGPGLIASSTFFTQASTTQLTVAGTLYSVLASTSALTISNLGNAGTNCLQISNQGIVSATGSSCTAFNFATTYNTLSAATTSPMWFQGSPFSLFASSTVVLTNSTTTSEAEGVDTVNNWAGRISPTHAIALGTGTTTTWTASTTGSAYSPYIAAPFIGTLRQVTCLTDSSFVGVNIKINGTNVAPSYFVASTTGGIINFTGSNTFTKGQKILADFGTTTTSGALSINCTVLVTEIP